MWQDPTNVAKRKPRRLRGTPANRFTQIITFAVVGAFSSFFLWYTHSEAGWVQRAKTRVMARIKPKETEEIRREMFGDSTFGSIVNQVNERQLVKELAKREDGQK